MEQGRGEKYFTYLNETVYGDTVVLSGGEGLAVPSVFHVLRMLAKCRDSGAQRNVRVCLCMRICASLRTVGA